MEEKTKDFEKIQADNEVCLLIVEKCVCYEKLEVYEPQDAKNGISELGIGSKVDSVRTARRGAKYRADTTETIVAPRNCVHQVTLWEMRKDDSAQKARDLFLS